MKFLVDRCAGRRLADWLRAEGHDVVETRERGRDPVVLRWAAVEGRVLVTIDTDFGALVFQHGKAYCGVARLPDVTGAESPLDRRLLGELEPPTFEFWLERGKRENLVNTFHP